MEVIKIEKFNYVEGGPTADLTVEAYGSSMEEAIANAALAMFNAITPLEGIMKRDSKTFKISGDDLQGLLYNFLDELLFIQEIEDLVFSGIKVSFDEKRMQIEAECIGETFDRRKHEPGIVIKAVTFHQMKIERSNAGWVVRVVLDT